MNTKATSAARRTGAGARFSRTACAVFLAAAFYAARAVAQADDPFADRYGDILKLWPMPPPPPPDPVPEPIEEPVLPEDFVPPSLEQVKLTLITRYGGRPAAGFIDGAVNKPYYLTVGQKFDDFELMEVDPLKQNIRLKRGMDVAVITIHINPATTNQADVTTFGMPSGGAAATAPRTGRVPLPGLLPALPRAPTPYTPAPRPMPVNLSEAQRKRIEEMRARRDEFRRRQEEAQRAARENLENMTPEQRRQHLRDTNVDIIINNSGPPLPIELNQDDKKRLDDAGFHVPGYSAPPAAAGAAPAPQTPASTPAKPAAPMPAPAAK